MAIVLLAAPYRKRDSWEPALDDQHHLDLIVGEHAECRNWRRWTLKLAIACGLYDVICECCERAPTILTSKRDLNEWPTVFANPLMGRTAWTGSSIERQRIVIEGKSHRVDTLTRRIRSLEGQAGSEG